MGANFHLLSGKGRKKVFKHVWAYLFIEVAETVLSMLISIWRYFRYIWFTVIAAGSSANRLRYFQADRFYAKLK